MWSINTGMRKGDLELVDWHKDDSMYMLAHNIGYWLLICLWCQSISLVYTWHSKTLKYYLGLKIYFFNLFLFVSVFSSEPQTERPWQFRLSLMASYALWVFFFYFKSWQNVKQDSVCTVTSVPVNSLCTGFGYIFRKLKFYEITNAVAYTQN